MSLKISSSFAAAVVKNFLFICRRRQKRERAGEKKEGMCLQLFYFFFEHLPLADRNVSSVWVQVMGRYFQITGNC